MNGHPIMPHHHTRVVHVCKAKTVVLALLLTATIFEQAHVIVPLLFLPTQVLRKGSGTLCEQLLIVQAFNSKIVCPNKHTSEQEVFYKVGLSVVTSHVRMVISSEQEVLLKVRLE